MKRESHLSPPTQDARPVAGAELDLRERPHPARQPADSARGGFPLAVCIALLLVAGAWLRWPFLRNGLWRDEASSVYIARSSSLKQFIGRAGQDYNPPLFTAVLALFVKAAGYEESAVKAFGY
ncbi:MAG TPA: hypothetical protein VJA66_14045, partial [Thermoanaerobaculia bacterium]